MYSYINGVEKFKIESINPIGEGYPVRREKTHSIFVEFLCITDWEKDSISFQKGETVDYKWVSKDKLLAMRQDELVTERMQKYIEELNLD